MDELVRAIKELFFVRDDAYARQIEGLNEYSVIKEAVTEKLIKDHLNGRLTIGSFQIDPENNKVKWICFDFDVDENSSLEIEFEKAKVLCNRLKKGGYHPLLEFSGRRGYHVWLFVEPVDSSIARKFALDISRGIRVHEVFPKQDRLNGKKFGAMVKVPLGIHMASNKWSYFYNNGFERLSSDKSREFLTTIKKRDVIKVINIKAFASE